MSGLVTLVACEKVPLGQAVEVVADGQVFAVFHLDSGYYVLDGMCPHAGGPLGKGTLQGCVVTCPWHGWQFDVTTGRNQLSETMQQTCYPVQIVDGFVCIARSTDN